MNRILISLLALILSQHVSAQKDYFLYLQSEGGQPFFIRMNDQTYSSTSNGYLILSRMRDSSYTFRLGWPGKPDEQPYFTVRVAAKDRGLLIKNFAGEGWGLFDLQSLEVLKSHPASETNSSVRLEPRQVSNFTDVLAKAANDPSLRMKEVKVEKPTAEEEIKTEEKKVVKKEEPALAKVEEEKKAVIPVETRNTEDTTAIASTKKETVPSPTETVIEKAETTKVEIPAVKDTVAIEKPVPVVEEKAVAQHTEVAEVKAPVQTEKKVESDREPATEPEVGTNYGRSKISRRSESSTTEGFSLTYIDEYQDGKRDTIRILIPNSSKPWQKEPAKVPVAEEKKFLDIPVAATDAEVKATAKTNSCPAKATEADYLKLRKKMAAVNTDDGMIREAKKGFEQKCYTVKQVRNLGTLFSNDAAKFQFFEAATNHVSDADNIAQMGDDLKNEYYLRRFKKVLEER